MNIITHKIVAGPPYRPVIESKEFYRLFPALKRQLDKQVVTHRSAGEFLHTMKTSMTKLKVRVVYNKEGHHVSYSCPRRTTGVLCLVRTCLLWLLDYVTSTSSRNYGVSPCTAASYNALAFGYVEIDPEHEPLKVNLLMMCSWY